MKSLSANKIRVDRQSLSVVDLHTDGGALSYWLKQPPIKRLEGLELLRQIAHPYDPATARLPRLLTVVDRSPNQVRGHRRIRGESWREKLG